MLSGIENRLNDGLQLREMPVEEFAKTAALDGVRFASKSKLFEAFRGVKALSNETAVACWNLWTEIEALCKEAEPLVLSLNDGEKVFQWVKARRKEELSVMVGKFPQEQRTRAHGFLSALGGQ